MKVIDLDLLERFRGRACEICGALGRNHPHHLTSRGVCRLDVKFNLVTLCWVCHRKAHDGNIPRQQLVELVADRTGITADELMEKIWELRRK